MKNLVCAYQSFYGAKNITIPDELFANMSYLSDAYNAFYYAKIKGNKVGNKLFYNDIRLFAITNLFYEAEPVNKEEAPYIDFGESISNKN